MNEPILIAVENGAHRAAICATLRQEGYYPLLEAENGQRALELLRQQPDTVCVLAQIDLADIKGVDFISRIHAVNAHVPIILLVKTESDPLLPQVLDAGADDFLLLPPSPLRLKMTLHALFRYRMVPSEPSRVRRYAENHLKFKDIVTKSAKMRDLVAQAKLAVRRQANILIFGEKGCEHGLFARIIHRENKTRHGNFVRLQCVDTRENEIERHNWQAEIAAKLLQAHQGSLCLIDIDRLDEPLQYHLIEILEQVLNDKSQDVCFIATTTRSRESLAQESLVEGQKILPRLLSLLGSAELEIPPLRERQLDIEALCQAILKVVVAETGRRQISAVGARTLALLQDYDWPGILTELENSMFRAVFLSDGPILTTPDFPQIWRKFRLETMGHDNEAESFLPLQGGDVFWDEFGHIRPLSEIEKLTLDAALQRYGGRLSEVARRRGLGRSTLYRKMEAYKIMRNT